MYPLKGIEIWWENNHHEWFCPMETDAAQGNTLLRELAIFMSHENAQNKLDWKQFDAYDRCKIRRGFSRLIIIQDVCMVNELDSIADIELLSGRWNVA